jgi:hypothetical protein
MTNRRTVNNRIEGEMACRRLSAKAMEVYNTTDPLTVYAYETEGDTKYDVDGAFVADGLTFDELNAFFEDIAEELANAD